MNNCQGICVIGLGKAGLPLACTIADSGLSVVGLDVNKEYVDRILRKENPIPEEPGVQEILDKCIGNNFTVVSDPDSADLVECGVHIVIVPLFIDEETKITFQEMLNCVEKFSSSELFKNKNETIGLILENSIQDIIAYLGIINSGKIVHIIPPNITKKNFINQIKQEVDVDIEEVEIIKENIVFKTPGKLN